MEYNVVSFLENSYRNYPKKYVCIDEDESLSYEELWETSHIIAENLIDKINRGNPVPILMKKSCKTLRVIWGIIKAGGCYVVIDPTLPQERILSILKVCSANFVISDKEYEKMGNLSVAYYSELIKNNERILSEDVNDRITSICDVDPLYVMFTSGSTGIPKGVVVSHRSVMDFINCFVELFDIQENDILGNQAPWDFDVSVKDIFSAIKVGATIQIIPKKYFSLPVQLVDFLDSKKISVLIWAVSALCIVSSRNLLRLKCPSSIHKIIFSGEVMPTKQYNIWREAYPKILFANVYGPTEITCNCTYYIVNGKYGENEVIPIGKAFPNERVFLMDENNLLIDKTMQDKIGEICVSGTAVGLGYYGEKEITEANFVQNPLNNKYTEIIYKTGDMGYYNSTGELCYSSRKDFQIKHMGHRIELTEVERVLNNIDSVEISCCVYFQNTIVAFIQGNFENKMVIHNARNKLPSYMIPERIIKLENMPLNKNGKIDRQELKKILEVSL